jgi:hypothetical protein
MLWGCNVSTGAEVKADVEVVVVVISYISVVVVAAGAGLRSNHSSM